MHKLLTSSFLILFFSPVSFLKASENSFSEKKHSIGAGLGYHIFLNDLKDENKNTLGYSLSYDYNLSSYNSHRPSLGLDVQYYLSKKDSLKNEHSLITPYFSMLLGIEEIPNLGMSLGLEVDSWTQKSDLEKDLTIHKDLLFSGVLGVHWIAFHGPWGGLQVRLDFHLQEFHLKTGYLSPGLKYIWRF